MKKKLEAIVITFIMVICGICTDFSATSVWAMENREENKQILETTNDIMPFSGNEEFPYAGNEHYVGMISNFSENLTPVKTASSNSSTHRMIFRIEFVKSTIDQGIGNIQLMVYIKRSNGYEQCITATNTNNINGSTTNYVSFQTDWVNVSPGEKFQIDFDVISANQSISNGKLRYATLKYWVYID